MLPLPFGNTFIYFRQLDPNFKPRCEAIFAFINLSIPHEFQVDEEINEVKEREGEACWGLIARHNQ